MLGWHTPVLPAGRKVCEHRRRGTVFPLDKERRQANREFSLRIGRRQFTGWIHPFDEVRGGIPGQKLR